MNPEVFAVDFDGTLCENAWPEIGEPRYNIINLIKELRKNGHKIILWTCRDGMALVDALTWCSDYGLFFDAVNDNLEEHKRLFGGNSRKIMADYYIDDKSLYPTSTQFLFDYNSTHSNPENDEYNPTEMWQ